MFEKWGGGERAIKENVLWVPPPPLPPFLSLPQRNFFTPLSPTWTGSGKISPGQQKKKKNTPFQSRPFLNRVPQTISNFQHAGLHHQEKHTLTRFYAHFTQNCTQWYGGFFFFCPSPSLHTESESRGLRGEGRGRESPSKAKATPSFPMCKREGEKFSGQLFALGQLPHR